MSLVQRILAGDKQAVTEFYYQYAKKLLWYLKKRVPEDLAEEMLSDVMLEAIDALPTLREDTHVKTWLYKIAKNKTIDYYRRKKLKTIVLSQVPFLELVAEEINEPEFQLEKNALRDKIEETLRSLSYKYTNILRLHYEEHVSIRDMATALHLSTKATESLLYRARQSFMKAYERT